tara:strand:- start:14 stop:466 length:453 start_codon:yes stop_codon:yes gene_type:complete
MDWLTFFLFFLTCCVAASTGALFPPNEWYGNLKKPTWNPPDWLFPIAWSILYLIIAYVGMRISLIPGPKKYLIALWALQISLNTIWTPIFFGLNNIKLAMRFIIGLWISVLLMVITYWFEDPLSAILICPYFIWVSFAATLNFRIMQLNK